jgi:polyhydroxyalkanoate synthesis regulator protein
MQGLMDAYLEQGKAMFEKKQAQMQLPATLFPGVPGFPPKR